MGTLMSEMIIIFIQVTCLLAFTLKNFFTRFYLFTFRGEGREKQRERNINL